MCIRDRLQIAEHYKVDFIYNYEEIGNQIYGVAVYSNNELTEICLEEEDFEQYSYNEETDTYTCLLYTSRCV